MSDHPDGLMDSLVALNRLMVTEESMTETLARVADLACRTITVCDSAGVTVRRDHQASTVAFHGDLAVRLDQAQYDQDNGPCLVAFREQRPVHLENIADHAVDWPHFVDEAAELGVTTSLSLPFIVDGEGIGALNLYSRTNGAFGEEAQRLARLFSEQAAVAVANAEVYWRTYALTENLRAALDTRDVIGQAKGVLMAQRKITSSAAFELLREASQRRNIKLREVADLVVATGELPAGPVPGRRGGEG